MLDMEDFLKKHEKAEDDDVRDGAGDRNNDWDCFIDGHIEHDGG